MTSYLAVIGAGILFLFSLVGSFFVGKSKGKSAEQIKNIEENSNKEIKIAVSQNKERVDAVNDAIKIKDDVNRLDAGSAADKLRRDWSRD
ncbi:hypothetical protein QJS24_gp49 [Serratia phage vB_SmaS_Rovert]|uniref:I-spanin n=1 Tax=Serratia phage vB_SmaS_Rovert TaxID=2777363 RepID=A0A7T3N9U0_9CAUD|nr:hypothetical protein QJS24_gp49 [Serratia phage vB_SmaS_Rovert]QPX75016.1 hypothetical protein [Serratia phage vB_SmaS_Rovert]